MKPLVYSLTLALFAGGTAGAQVDVDAQVESGAQVQSATDAETNADVDAAAEVQTSTTEEVREVANEAVDQTQQSAQDSVEETSREIEEAVDEPAREVREATEEATDRIEEASEDVRETTRNARRESREAQRQITEESQDALEDATDEIPAAPELDGEAPEGTPEIEEDVREIQDELEETVPETDRRMRARTNSRLNSNLNSAASVSQLGFTIADAVTSGIVIGQTLPNGPAARFGLQPGDRIISFNNQRYTNQAAFRDALRNWTPAGPVPIIYERNGQRFTQTMPISLWNANPSLDYSNESYSSNSQPQSHMTARPVYDGAYSQPQQFAPQGYVQPCAGQGWSTPGYGNQFQGYQSQFGTLDYNNGWDRKAARQHRRMMRRLY